MSTGPRIPLAVAQAAAALLFQKWKMPEPQCAVVGSVRRGRHDVGDLEFIAPAAPLDNPKADPLFDAIEATLIDTDRLFSADEPFAQAIRGVKRGFYGASLTVRLRLEKDAAHTIVPVQIYRYDAGAMTNRGWVELCRTGPSELGIWFLQEWKRIFGIQAGPASADGHLVDSYMKRVPVEDELACFRLIRHEFVPPHQRDAFMQHIEEQRQRASREAMR